MKKLLMSLMICFTLFTGVFATNPPDEGMWLPMLIERLNYVDMQKMGLHLTAEELYNVNNASLKDAIVGLANEESPTSHFCTAEVVSDKGLLFTNHHCGFDAIQSQSSIEHDYLTNGFWAFSNKEELRCEGVTASFLVRMEDVTAKVLAELKDNMTEPERDAAIKKISGKLEKEASEKGKYEADVKSFFDGNEFYMFVYIIYKDVRLVGAPPSAIGKFGGDTDNWMWPRHTGDFSMLRIYCAPDGSPAAYSENNVPLKPKHHLPISLKGVKKDDFSMIWGYPGSTERYMTSYAIKTTLEQTNPAIINAGDIMLPIMKKDMEADPAVRIKYASTYAQLANVWKNKIGESRGLKRLKVYDKKKALEDELQKWIDADEQRKEKYGNILKDIEDGNKQLLENKSEANFWYFQMILMSSKTLLAPLYTMGMSSLVENKDTKPEAYNDFKGIMKDLYKDANAATEKKLFIAGLEILRKEMPADIFDFINSKYKGDIQKFTDEAFKTSIYASEEAFNNFVSKPNAKKFNNDLIRKTTLSILNYYRKSAGEQKAIESKLDRATRLFSEAVRTMQSDKKFYPDANSTMRMTYGKVLDYDAADAVHYNYYTTLKGVMEKEDPSNDEFIVPAKLKQLYEAKDFGRYGKNGEMPVCFIANLDITGGNSGSPVINGDGQLIGIAFDGNWEAMSGDIAYEPDVQRTICVDIRYVLFVIDKYAGAKNLIDEMTIVQ